MGMVWNSSTASNDEDSMSDWATEQARIVAKEGKQKDILGNSILEPVIAFALRSAFQRGKVEGMRDAADVAQNHVWGRSIDWWMTTPKKQATSEAALECVNAIRARATALEQENT
jgi:hypothetical protein